MAGLRNPANDSGFVFNGLRGRNNSISIDGVDNRDETTGGNRVAVGLEMIQEFRVSGTSVSSEFGGAAGGLVNIVTHTGQNIWHGDATFFLQNEDLNARNPEVELGARPLVRKYQPGTSAGGPIKRDRTFFFLHLSSLGKTHRNGRTRRDVIRAPLIPPSQDRPLPGQGCIHCFPACFRAGERHRIFHQGNAPREQQQYADRAIRLFTRQGPS